MLKPWSRADHSVEVDGCVSWIYKVFIFIRWFSKRFNKWNTLTGCSLWPASFKTAEMEATYTEMQGNLWDIVLKYPLTFSCISVYIAPISAVLKLSGQRLHPVKDVSIDTISLDTAIYITPRSPKPNVWCLTMEWLSTKDFKLLHIIPHFLYGLSYRFDLLWSHI